MSIPGADYYLAALISSYIEDVHRSSNADKLAVFFGIVPTTKDSSSIRRRGHTSKEGSAEAGWVLPIAVDTVMMRNKAIKDYCDSVKEKSRRESLST
ncbi:MAG: transposase [Thermoplasmatales archaeon]